MFESSGHTKIEGLAIEIVRGTFELGVPRLASSAADLFRDEYRLPLLLVVGLGTRFAALGLLVMTAVVQFHVYPGAYATHGVWAAVLLWLMALWPGVASVGQGLIANVMSGTVP